LIEEGLLIKEQLVAANDRQIVKKSSLQEAIIDLGYLTENQIVDAIVKHYGFTYLLLQDYNIDKEIVDVIPEEKCRQYKLIPISLVGKLLTVAMADPLNIVAIDDIALRTNTEVLPVMAKEKEIDDAINQYYGKQISLETIVKDGNKEVDIKKHEDQIDVSKGSGKVTIDETPIIRLANHIIATAVRQGASDIHIEPREKLIGVRYRIDGSLIEEESLPKSIQASLISRIKIMSKMDISEHRLPQDGRIKIVFENRAIDLRVSTLPLSHGEKIVMRILDRGMLKMKLESLGFDEFTLNKFAECIKLPYGLNLVTGPTGSGKTSTLYAALNFLNDPTMNIVTVEEPVEYELNRINQVPVNSDIGLTFANALRSILRQDPDIIMVGEIRDKETLDIAIKSALTGHLVLSTLHTNDAPSTLVRLSDMGGEPYMVASALQMILAQRLMRKLCESCKEPTPVPDEIMPYFRGLETKPTQLFKAVGCNKCHNTGMKGRIGAVQLMPITDTIRTLISTAAPFNEIKQNVRDSGVKTLRENAFEKVAQGIVSVEEAISETI